MRAKILMLLFAAAVFVSLGTAAPAQAQFYRYRAPAYQVTPFGAAYRSPQVAVYGRSGAYYSPSYTTYSAVNFYPAVSPYGYAYVQPVYSAAGFYAPPSIQRYGYPYTISPYVPAYYQYNVAP